MKSLPDIINRVHCADCLTFLRDMPDGCVNCVVTSPPYWGLRDYGCEGQIGLEPTIELYISHLVEIFAECKRVLRKDGTMFINIGDSYGGSNSGGIEDNKATRHGTGATSLGVNRPTATLPSKSLCQVPERLSIALTDQLGLIKRNTIIWYKRNCMPSSASDRFTVDFEYLYFFTKSQDYWFEQQFEESIWGLIDKRAQIKGGAESNGKAATGRYAINKVAYTSPESRNKRTVWDIPTEATNDCHFAAFPRALVRTPILAGCPSQIFNQCGKARKRMYELGEIVSKGGSDKGMRAANDWDGNKDNYWTGNMVQREKLPRGYTDCGCNSGFYPGIVLDPFAGSGTTCLEAKEQGKNYIGIELKPEYIEIANRRMSQEVLPFNPSRQEAQEKLMKEAK